MDRVRQCPCCPIRFLHRTELEWHLREEHPDTHVEYVTRSQRTGANATAVPEPRQPTEGAASRAPRTR